MSTTCSICFNDIPNNEMCSLNCNHQFCKTCVDQILQTSIKKCPNCRTNILSYLYLNQTYNIIIINENDNQSLLHQRRSDLLVIANRKLLKYGYFTTFSLLYLLYSYMTYYFSSYNTINDITEKLNTCNHNYTDVFQLLNDESWNVIIYNYAQNQKCMISDFSYQKCFNLFTI